MNNGQFWADYARQIWIPEIEVLQETIEKRVLPSFSMIEQESEAVREAERNRLNFLAGPDTDPGDLAEAVHEAGVDYYIMRDNARQAVINIFAVALHHLVEQQQLVLLRRELLPKSDEDDYTLLKRKILVSALVERGIDITTFSSWARSEELKLLANTVKHADGDSADLLAKLRPDLFTPPVLKREESSPLYGLVGRVYTPLAGTDLYLTDEDLTEYFTNAVGFWLELMTAMVIEEG